MLGLTWDILLFWCDVDGGRLGANLVRIVVTGLWGDTYGGFLCLSFTVELGTVVAIWTETNTRPANTHANFVLVTGNITVMVPADL